MLKRFLRICSVLLALVMLVNMLPLNAVAEEYFSASAERVTETPVSGAQIVEEVEEHRTEFSKEFKLDNGLYVSAVYAQPVHYEVDGAWKEIDNTLRTQLDGTYSNTAGLWDVRFPQQLSGSNAITITKDGHTLSFGLAGELRQPGNLEIASATQAAELTADASAERFSITVDGTAQTFAVQSAQIAQGQIQAIDLTQAKEEAQYEEFVVGKNVSQLLYANVYQNTDIQYDLKANQVKESVILESYSSSLRGYRYTLNVGDMVPVLQEDNSIYFYDAEQKNVVMVMPAPYLVDADEQYNHDIQVSLTSKGSTWVLAYVLPTAWLAAEERAWPVVLDPVVIADLSDNNIQDTTVISARPAEANYMRSMLQIGYSANDGISRIYLGFDNLPTLTSSDVIVQAVVSLNKVGVGSGTVPATVHKVNNTWEVESLRWSNAPASSETIEDYAMVTNAGRYYWNVTDIVRDWYTGSNTGMVIKASNEVEQSGDTTSWKEFYSCNYGNDTTDPVLAIYFRNNNGLENYWDYTSASAGRAGTGYINNYTGNLVWVHPDIGFGGNRMPVSISHVYNANDAITPEDTNNSNDSGGNYFGLGTGWRTNFHQRLYQWKTDSTTTAYYIWEDSDGTDHYFTADSEGKLKDEDGLELTLTTNGSGTTKYCIEDKNGNKSYFDTYGRLTKQENNQKTPSSITITYDPNEESHISLITDGAGRKYSFTYSNGLLSRISYTGTGSTEISYVSFTYSGNQLTRITDKDGKYATYAYGSNSLLSSAADVDGYQLRYTYNTTAGPHQPYRVKRVVESDGSALGGELTFSYAHNETTITDVVNGNKQIIQFNSFGNTVSIQDGQGRAQFAQYANNDSLNTESTEKANQLRLSSKLQNTVGDRLYNSNFENGAVWSVWPAGTSCENVTTEAYQGSHSLLFTATEWSCLMSDYFMIEPGATYTFSAYVKGVSGTTYLMLVNRDDMSSNSTTATVGSTGWKRVEVSYTNTTSTAVAACAQFFGTEGSQVYFDCAQVERAVTASRYNLLENGDFRHGAYGWSNSGGYTAVSSDVPAAQLTSSAYSVTGSPTAQKRMSQALNISGSKDDTFVLAGWAKGNAVPMRDLNDEENESRQFAVLCTLNYTDGTTGEFAAQFNPDTDSWQYSAEVVVAKSAYSSITVSLAYDYSANTACFDGIQLYKEEFGTSYTYDDEGNVTSVKDLQGQVTDYKYNTEGELYQILQGNKAKMTYTYDDWHNVKTATSKEGIVYEFTYDGYGNNTIVSIVSSGEKITSTAAYTSDGNRLQSTTDALGKTTTYSYNADTNVLEWVQYPNDTEATRTNYTYDSMYRLASAAVTTDTGDNLYAAYTYQDDLLTKIQTASTTYSFSYGNFALRTAVKIGTRTLASYEYTNDRNYYLNKLAYGNGDSVQYAYDSQGRIVKETYEDGATVSYQYDNNGALATVTDSETGIKTTYYYDFTDRMMKYVESGGYSHSVGYAYDQLNNLTSLVETINGVEHTTSYTYDEDNRISSVTNGNVSQIYTYDGFGRISQQKTNNGSSAVLTDTYTFRSPTGTTTSTQITAHAIAASGLNASYSYTYDDNGNILSISDGTYTISYTYDSANQLTRENNQRAGKTWTWAYDNAGNILNRKEYAYTTGALGAVLDTVRYTYEDSQWGDLLTSYDGTAITYDTIGNMLDDGTWEYTWQHGRELEALFGEDVNGGANDVTVEYEYNANGLRIGKTVTTNTYSTHTHSYTTTVIAPTCTEEGYTLHSCNECGDLYQDTILAALGHAFPDGSYACSRCGVAHPHSYTSTVVSATCTEGGYTLHECECGDSYRDAETAPRGHFYPSATATVCTRCGASEHVHSYTITVVSATCTEDGYTLYTCTCGDSYRDNETAALGHTLVDGSNTCSRCGMPHTHSYTSTVVSAACTEGGYTLHECACGASYQDTETSPKGHFYPTPTATVCTRCGYNRAGVSTLALDTERELVSTVVEEYSYIYNGDKVTQAVVKTTTTANGTTTTDTQTLYFAYNANGIPMSVTYGNTTYYYVTNIQGDVIAILNTSGTAVTTYAYDAWGNILDMTGTMAETLGTVNPLRYRGYVYDTETGFYYVSSRYYDPEIGRWINADSVIAGTGENVLGYNMFAYCFNNPVNMSDPTGNWPSWSTVLKAAAIAVTAVAVVAAVAVTVATFGATSIAATIVVSSAITIAAKATEVAVLQGKKSASEGKNTGQVATDIIESVFDNGVGTVAKTAVTKTAGYATGFYSQSSSFQDVMKLQKMDGYNLKTLAGAATHEIANRFTDLKYCVSAKASTGSMLISYGFAGLNVVNTVISIFADDPVQRATRRGYTLK